MRFLFVDRILSLSSPTGSVCGIKHITPTDFYLSSDESGRHCFIPALIGETLGQMTAWAVMHQNDFRLRPVAGIVESVTLERAAYVGETLALESWIDALDDTAVQYHGEVRVGSELVFRLEGALGPMLPMEDFIDPMMVRRQFAEINRPGDWPYLPQAAPLAIAESQRQIALVYDHITDSVPGVRMSAVKHVTRAAPYFPDHFPHKPVLPLTVLLECHMNLAKEFLAHAGLSGQYRIHTLRRIKMSDFVYPGDVVSCDVTVKSHSAHELILRFCATVAGKRINVLEMVLAGVGDR
jgi:3-hydroxymyristoyl/3-hydroxydecanoyl-(acyl carrier protein) dehydratase